jgi:hypothetical protein
MVLILNLVLCALVIAMVVAPLARAVARSRPETIGRRSRRQPAFTSTRAASRMRTPALGGSDR